MIMNRLYGSFAYIKYQFLKETQFKINIIFVLFGSFIASVIQYYLWNSIEINSKTDTSNYMIYAIVVIVINLFLPITQVAITISNMIVKGQLVIWLLRPHYLIETVFYQTIGKSIFLFIFQCIPLLISFIYIFRINLNVGFVSGIKFLLAFILGYIMAFLIGYIIGLLSVYFISINGFVALINGCMIIFGGSIIPIAIYPIWLQVLTTYTPFYYIIYYPLSIITIGETSSTPILIQILWIVILVFVTLVVSKKIFSKANMSGG